MKRKLIVVIGIALVLALVAALYPQIGKKAIANSTCDYLARDGYTNSEISLVDVRHSYINWLLGYGQWHTSIQFADEPDVEYQCILSDGIISEVLTITTAGFSPELPENYEPLHYPQ